MVLQGRLFDLTAIRPKARGGGAGDEYTLTTQSNEIQPGQRKPRIPTILDSKVNDGSLSPFKPALNQTYRRRLQTRTTSRAPNLQHLHIILRRQHSKFSFATTPLPPTLFPSSNPTESQTMDDPTNPAYAITSTDPHRASAILSQLRHRRRLLATHVPTSDPDVRRALQTRSQPQTLFGEGPPERRDRLRELVAAAEAAAEEKQARNDGFDDADASDGDVSMDDAGTGAAGTPADGERAGGGGGREEQEEFYTEGGAELLAVRRRIASYSLPRARREILRQKAETRIPLRAHVKHRDAVKARLRGFDLHGSQTAGRPVGAVRFAPAGDAVLMGTWSGEVSLLSVPDLETVRTFQGHTDRVRGLDWSPLLSSSSSVLSSQEEDGGDAPSGEVAFTTAGADGRANLYSLTSHKTLPVHSIPAHTQPVRRSLFHPSGEYLATASDDTTWRLFSVAHLPSTSTSTSTPTATPLLVTEGHTGPVHALSFNATGSLLASGGADATGRVWDLRTGRTIMILAGHMREVHSCDWDAGGYRVLTGAGDGLGICWDVRMVREVARVPMHSRGVTEVRWFKGEGGEPRERNEPHEQDSQNPPLDPDPASLSPNGNNDNNNNKPPPDNPPNPTGKSTFTISCGFDKQISLFGADDWTPCRVLGGHASHVLGCDVSGDGRWVVSGGYDRTVKIWGV